MTKKIKNLKADYIAQVEALKKLGEMILETAEAKTTADAGVLDEIECMTSHCECCIDILNEIK